MRSRSRQGKPKWILQSLRPLMTVLCFFALSACAGESNGVVDLRNNASSVGCNTTVADNLTTGTLTSRDGKATLTANNLQFPISISITVDCQKPTGQIGNAYIIDISQSFVSVVLTISYSGIDLSGINVRDLKLGTYDDVNRRWFEESNMIRDFTLQTISLSAPQPARYAIFVDSVSSGGDTLQPTEPTIQSITLLNRSIVITWSQSSDPGGGFISSYNISRQPPGSQIWTSPGSQLSFEDRGQTAPFETSPQSYCYTVVAVDDEGDRSDPSDARCSQPFLPQ